MRMSSKYIRHWCQFSLSGFSNALAEVVRLMSISANSKRWFFDDLKDVFLDNFLNHCRNPTKGLMLRNVLSQWVYPINAACWLSEICLFIRDCKTYVSCKLNQADQMIEFSLYLSIHEYLFHFNFQCHQNSWHAIDFSILGTISCFTTSVKPTSFLSTLNTSAYSFKSSFFRIAQFT